MRVIFRRENRRDRGPGNPQSRIVPKDASLILWRVIFGALVHEGCRLARHAETVGAARRNGDLEKVLAQQFYPIPFPETG